MTIMFLAKEIKRNINLNKKKITPALSMLSQILSHAIRQSSDHVIIYKIIRGLCGRRPLMVSNDVSNVIYRVVLTSLRLPLSLMPNHIMSVA